MIPARTPLAGGGRRARAQTGFTLIELTVVMALIALLLGVSLPRVRGTLVSGGTDKFSRWLIQQVPALKSKALSEQRRHTLMVDPDRNRLWVTDESMSAEKQQAAAQKGYSLSGGARLTAVEFAHNRPPSPGAARIHFYARGYCDRAIIHVSEGDERLSFVIEPFLAKVKRYENYITFAD